MSAHVIPVPRPFTFAVALAAIGLLGLGWFLGASHPEGGRIIGLAMAGGYAAAILALLYRASRWQSERKGWLFLAAAMVCAAVVNQLLTEEGGHQLGVRPDRLIKVLLLAAVTAILMARGVLAWPLHRPARQAAGRTLLNSLGGLFTGTSLWLLFWMGGTWHEQFQGRSAHHIHLLILGSLVAAMGGVSSYLFLGCPRRARGPIGVILVGLTLLTALFGILSIIFNAQGHHAGFAVLPGLPLVVALAALKEAPAELCVRSPHPGLELPEMLPFLPFLTLGPVIALALWREGGPLLWPALSLLIITGLLAARQLLLLRELKIINGDLESRVVERTQTVRDLQSRQIRQERMNTLAMLGAGMIHDMNNALGVVMASVDLARMDSAEGPTPLQGHLDRIHRATGQLAGLSQRIMAFARRDVEKPHLIDLAEEIRVVEPLLHMLLPKNVRLSVQILNTPPQVLASRGLLEQVLVNLVANARDAMPEGGDLRVSLRMATGNPATALLAVSDTGRGIPPHIREQLFTPFFTTKPAGRGTGLGLASTKAIMEEVGGGISLDSREGQGTTFTLRFPIPVAVRSQASPK